MGALLRPPRPARGAVSRADSVHRGAGRRFADDPAELGRQWRQALVLAARPRAPTLGARRVRRGRGLFPATRQVSLRSWRQAEHTPRRDSTGCSATRTQTRRSTRDSPPWTNSSRRARRTGVSGTRTTPSARRVATRASGRACALSRGGDRAVGRVIHSQTLLRHCATSARALRNEPSEMRARPLHARASPAAPIDGTLEGTTLVLVKIVSSSVKIDVVSAELHFGTHYGTVLPGSAL